MLNSVYRYRTSIILVLAVFSVVVVLFSGYHSMNLLEGYGNSHQFDKYSCLYTICVAILTIFLLFTFFIFTFAIPDPVPSPESQLIFLLEKPPRG